MFTNCFIIFYRSLGLAIPPRIRFLKRREKFQNKIGQKPADTNIFPTKEDSNSENESKMEQDSDQDSGPQNTKSSSESESEEKSESGSEESSEAEDEAESESEEESESRSEKSETSKDSNSNLAKPELYSKQNRTKVHKVKSKDNATETAEKKKTSVSKSKTEDTLSFNIDEDGLDDIIKVKKKAKQPIVEDTESSDEELQDLEEIKGRKRKATTKAALAKKVLKKNLTINTKVVFDDEGEVGFVIDFLNSLSFSSSTNFFVCLCTYKILFESKLTLIS